MPFMDHKCDPVGCLQAKKHTKVPDFAMQALRVEAVSLGGCSRAMEGVHWRRGLERVKDCSHPCFDGSRAGCIVCKVLQNQHARSDSAEKAIVTFSAQLDARGADSAKVRCTHDGQSWHAGGTDPKEPEHLC
uniref:Uncharacterized protein n=1 Tax=Coccidioides posadasii RMSCC 3488 TaxID=454284 RepID=A0A0J6ET55_COCPO|nr:hypothetical protein CPAG_00025 [Coccidioides posadasii RMSCC 3488]